MDVFDCGQVGDGITFAEYRVNIFEEDGGRVPELS